MRSNVRHVANCLQSLGHLVDGFRALKEITKENSQAFRPSEPGAIKERQYASDYLDSAPNSGKNIAIRKQILDGSRKFLEQRYAQSHLFYSNVITPGQLLSRRGRLRGQEP